MLNFEASPPIEPTVRHITEVASKSKDKIVRAGLKIDSQVLAAQTRARRIGYSSIPTFDDEIRSLTQQAHHAIAEADQSRQGTWRDYYRLVNQTAFLEHRLKAPLAFEQRTWWKEREQLVNGLYGVSAHIIDEALTEYDLDSTTPIHKEDLCGVIQEQTFIALFNREQLKKRIAMPSATYDDLYSKIDAEIWILPDRQNEPYYLPVQIKSSMRVAEEAITPIGGITIFAHEFDNSRNHETSHDLEISRLIALEYQYMCGTGEPLNDIQQAQLEDAQIKLFSIMEYKAGHAI